jgi:hypothetical protein
VSDILFDKNLKEDIKKYKLGVPEDISKNIDKTLESLSERKLKRNIKPAVEAAILMITALLGLGMAYPVNAQKLPIVRGLFSLIQESGLIRSEYIEFGEDVNQSVIHGDVEITVDNVIADENMIVITQQIKSSSKIQWENFLDMKEEIKIKGYGGAYSSSGHGFAVDDYSYYSIKSIELAEEAMPFRSYEIDYCIKDIKGINESFDYKFKVDKNKTLKETKTYNIVSPIKYSGGEYNVNKVVLSPISTKIQGIDNPIPYDVFLFDDKGNEIQFKSKGGIDKASSFEWNIITERINPNTKSITIVPYSKQPGWYYQNAEKIICEDYSKLPVTLSQGSIGSIIVKNIEYENDLMIIHYEVEGKIPYEQSDRLMLIDQEEKVVEAINRFSTMVPQNPKDNKAIFKIDKSKKYKIATTNLDKAYNILEDNKAVLELK